jgi:hypothetical protein
MELTNESIMPTKSISESNEFSRGRLWAGAIIGALLVAFLILDAVLKLLMVDAVVKASEQLGLPVSVTPFIGVLLLICVAIYVIPTTRILGAILLTGYLGGAIAIHVRAGNGTFPVVFATTIAVLVWVALVLREPGLFRLLLFRQWPASSDREAG